jgi:AraC-like DNA-binding protein
MHKYRKKTEKYAIIYKEEYYLYIPRNVSNVGYLSPFFELFVVAGFESPSHFIRYFRQSYKVSPLR